MTFRICWLTTICPKAKKIPHRVLSVTSYLSWFARVTQIWWRPFLRCMGRFMDRRSIQWKKSWSRWEVTVPSSAPYKLLWRKGTRWVNAATRGCKNHALTSICIVECPPLGYHHRTFLWLLCAYGADGGGHASVDTTTPRKLKTMSVSQMLY